MKKLMMLLLALMLCVPAYAEMPTVLPVKQLEHEEAAVPLADAMAIAKAAVDRVFDQTSVSASLVEMSDGVKAWVVTIYDIDTFAEAWCVTLNAADAKVMAVVAADDFFYTDIYDAWTAAKGPHALWSLEDKQLYDALYAMMPAYGLPMPGDLSAEDALKKALTVLGMDNAVGYEVGYGYLMGGEGYNGVWEICLVIDGQVDCRVNLDAVTGEVYYMETNLQDADEANG